MKNGQKSRNNVPIRFLIPNAITLLALSAGLTSIRMAYEQRFEVTIISVLFAAILDGIDGRAARLLNASSKFGAELDSLADFVNFGVAPGLIVYFWALQDAKSLGWVVSLIFTICICLRLARFNVESQEEATYKWKKKFFTGVPAPAGAFLVLTPFYCRFINIEIPSYLILLNTVAISILTVSQMPTFSFKNMGSMPRTSVRVLLVLIILLASVLAIHTWQTLLTAAVLYVATFPFSILSHRKYMQLEALKNPPQLEFDSDELDSDED
ncbi:MAG: CDP-diacylglycerol--serine O-phosphatidyltransferase [Bdellovibrionaceae bacterium]|nr:CDP-diacylglycerol--serine O-phosphatidyltransferase [Pseudobdellovibrionaceae bacterium]